LQNLSNVPSSEIRPEFKQQIENLKQMIYNNIKPKELHGNVLTGRMFITLCRTYVDAMNKGGIVIDSCWENVVRTECETAFLESIRLYKKLIHSRIKERGIIDYDQLDVVHREVEEESVKLFNQLGVGDEKIQYEQQLKRAIMDEYKKCRDSLCRMSTRFCEEILNNSFTSLDNKLPNYNSVHDLEKDFQNIVSSYRKNAKGGEKNNVLLSGLLRWIMPTFQSLNQYVVDRVQDEHSSQMHKQQQHHTNEVAMIQEDTAKKTEVAKHNHARELQLLREELEKNYSEQEKAIRNRNEEQVGDMLRDIAEERRQNLSLSESCNKYESQCNEFKLAIERLEACIQDQHFELSELKDANHELDEAKRQLATQLEQVTAENGQLLTASNQLKENSKEEQRSKEELKQQLHELRLECDTIRLESSNVHSHVSQLEQKNHDLLLKLNEHQLDYKSMEQSLNNKIQLLEQSTIPEMEQRYRLQIKKIKQQVERTEQERKEIAKKLEEEQVKSNDLSTELIATNHRSQKVERDIQSKNAHVRSLERAIQAEKEKSQESEERLRTSLREKTQLLSKDRAIELEKQVEQLNITNRRVLEINKTLMEDLNHYKNNSSIDSGISDLSGTHTPVSRLRLLDRSYKASPLSDSRRGSFSFDTPKKEGEGTPKSHIDDFQTPTKMVLPVKISPSEQSRSFKTPTLAEFEKSFNKGMIKSSNGVLVMKEVTLTQRRQSLVSNVTPSPDIKTRRKILSENSPSKKRNIEGKENDPNYTVEIPK
jgi:chromosome segregation ATPase